jgi:hypothetical protein
MADKYNQSSAASMIENGSDWGEAESNVIAAQQAADPEGRCYSCELVNS